MNIVFDWGGTIVKDQEVFAEIANRSGNCSIKYSGPDSWKNIRNLGNSNFLDTTQSSFFRIGISHLYPEAINVISSFCGQNNGTKTFIVFDNKPVLTMDPSDVIKYLSFAFCGAGGSINGFYLESNKLSLSKQIGADIFVEDDPRIAMTLAYANIKTILLIRKWNNWFNDTILSYTVPEHKIEKIRQNLVIAEDWVDVKKSIESFQK